MRWALVLSVACSRPLPIAADPTPPVDATVDAAAPKPARRAFMELIPGNSDCYYEIDCEVASDPCPEKWHDSKNTAKLRAAEPGAWCCTKHQICETPWKP